MKSVNKNKASKYRELYLEKKFQDTLYHFAYLNQKLEKSDKFNIIFYQAYLIRKEKIKSSVDTFVGEIKGLHAWKMGGEWEAGGFEGWRG